MSDGRTDDIRLPIKIDTTSNGEFAPLALPAVNRRAKALARERICDSARRLGFSRRAFLRSIAAAASTLYTFNQSNAEAGRIGGFFDVPLEANFEEAAALEVLGAREFVFDVQGHYVVPGDLVRTLKPRCQARHPKLSSEYMSCLGADNFIKDVFLDSDTDMMVLSFIPKGPASVRKNDKISLKNMLKSGDVED